MDKKLKHGNNRGVVLLIAAFIILLSSVLVIGFLEAATTDLQISQNHKSEIVATYIADAGIEAAVYDLINGGNGVIGKTEFPDTVDNNSYYTVTEAASAVGPDGEGFTTYTLQSLGEYGSFSRTIEAQIKSSGLEAIVIYWKEI